ncbi:MAG TPA: 3-hydroxyacyl-CoA dehydrogenase NAD-binding domain-containing protein [Burkholderiaceae bacterium]|nr:3-hydroxyacyl-CoA dehydrogenase NAD-binding domain-containing protein [Burkholderiaceae bacterium]HQR74812.1 3-hydroxyacyl-CoA dehydrogenase NAD-binding domain-containing protein [Burkholderiaceae bacterium]
MTTHYERRGQVAVLQIDNPPVNGLGHATRKALLEGLERALDDAVVRAIVITGTDRVFSGGADIREFNTPAALAEPNLLQLIDAVERSPKPVIAAINGVCMGGGLELSLGCNYRVATPDASLGLPEVKIGLLPGAGGTQRLPRAVGAELGLRMIVSGDPIPAAEALKHGLVERVVDRSSFEGVLQFAAEVMKGSRHPKLRDRSAALPAGVTAEAFFAAARADVTRQARGLPAPLKCVDAVEAAVTQAFEEGLAKERGYFIELVQSKESKALRHAFFAERTAAKIPDVPEDTATRPIRAAAVLGFGTMGGGIAMSFANAGIPVTVFEKDRAALDRGLAMCRRNWEATAKKGRLTAEQVEQRVALLKPTLDFNAVGSADIVIEAVYEDMVVKQDIFARLDSVMKRGAILATNTSTLDVDQIAAATSRPQDVIGTHFFSPANVMRLLEVVRGRKTGKDVLATVMQLAKRLKKVGVVSGVCDGFIGNRMLEQYVRQSLFLVDEGASPQQIDAALSKFGMAMGPFTMYDMAGMDIGYAIRQRRYVEKPHITYSRLADRVVELGRLGQKSGKGWYRYEAGNRTPLPDPEIDRLIDAYRAEIGLRPRRIDDEEIIQRCVYALVNEGARILAEGIALRASDIDVVYLTGYGFPVATGGPMFHAQTVGLADVVATMKRFAGNPHADPAFWEPAPLLVAAAGAGRWPK